MRWPMFAATITATTLATMVAPANARPGTPAFVPMGDIADAPAGWVEMCVADPAACGQVQAQPAGAVERTTLSDYFTSAAIVGQPAGTAAETHAGPAAPAGTDLALAETAEQVNRLVNRRTLQRSDLKTYGVDELWRPAGSGPGAIGDCEDIALEKRAELLAAGVSPQRLVLATVYRSGVGLHTVLVLRRDGGDFVLDSRTNRILPWARARYSWLRLQSAERPMEWRRVAIS